MTVEKNTPKLKKGLSQMLKGGVIMDVVDAAQAKIAEDAGAVAVMALERVPSDIRKDGGVARMSDPKMIKEIISQTNTQIDVSEDGRIKVYAKNSGMAEKAINWMNILAGNIPVGSVFVGKIKKITDFGIFVEIVGGKEGLVHISTIAKDKQPSLSKDFSLNDELSVNVVSYDSSTGRIRLVAPSLQGDRYRKK